VWESSVAGRVLKFHLAGINNQNFIMKDEETGSWWQQVSGKAIQGSLKGEALTAVLHDEIAFGIWKEEHPNGRVLLPANDAPWKRFSEDWEAKTAKLPTPLQANTDTRLAPRTEIVGLKVGQRAKAYPIAILKERSPLLDTLEETKVVIVVAEDGKSVRAFDRVVDGRVLEFFRDTDSHVLRLRDAESGSEWDFAGQCVSGPMQGKRLKQVYALKDYWFDWKTYNPGHHDFPVGRRLPEDERRSKPRFSSLLEK
jgi:hypothetical protein